MADVCEFHREMAERANATKEALDEKVSKSTIKWISGILMLPTILALASLYAFVNSADYRFGSYQQAKANEAKIQLLEERTLVIKSDLSKAQTDIMNHLYDIQKDLKFLTMRYMDKEDEERRKAQAGNKETNK